MHVVRAFVMRVLLYPLLFGLEEVSTWGGWAEVRLCVTGCEGVDQAPETAREWSEQCLRGSD